MIGPGDTVRAINQEDYDVTVGWGNVNYILKPQKDTFVPAEAIINYFGDPRSTSEMKSMELATGQHAWVPDRPTEVRRLRIKWARYNINNPEDDLIAPHVEVYTLDGDWVPTVANDPQGERVNAASLTVKDQFDRDAVIERMQAQLDQLLKERNLDQLVEPATVESQIPVDKPTQSSSAKKTVTPRAANDE